jgi:hypothetical protein
MLHLNAPKDPLTVGVSDSWRRYVPSMRLELVPEGPLSSLRVPRRTPDADAPFFAATPRAVERTGVAA